MHLLKVFIVFLFFYLKKRFPLPAISFLQEKRNLFCPKNLEALEPETPSLNLVTMLAILCSVTARL